MKATREKIVIILSILFFVFACYISAEANLKYVFANMMYGSNGINHGNILFSKESGFYEEEFFLRIYAPTDQIYYTLDGSEPDENSIKYTEGIRINDASQNPNLYSARTDVCAGFQEAEVQKYSGRDMNYKVPDYNVDKCTVLRAVYYDENGERSNVEERIYFVGFDEKSGYEDVNIISIVTDPENLFGQESGIYVLGDTYKKFMESGAIEDFWAKEYWYWWDGNFRNKGREWERESSIQVFNEDKKLVLSQNAGIRIQGGGSRGFLPKSLNLYAREEYGANKFYYDFWGTGYYPKRMTLTTGGDDYYTKMKDRLVSELAENCEFVKMNYEPYILFLNGEYWGFYYLTEKYDAQYIEEYYGVDKGDQTDDIIIIKNGAVEAGVEADYYEAYSEMVNMIANSNMNDEDNYAAACELIDIQSFIDYFAVQAYIARCGDWPDSNFALWRSRNVSEKPYEDGKWRWMLFDVNSTAIEYGLVEFDAVTALRDESGLFRSLYKNPSFRENFSARLTELTNTIFTEENVNQQISEYVELMEDPMENHFQRFFGESNDKFYEGVEEIRYFFNNRREYVLDSIEKNLSEF